MTATTLVVAATALWILAHPYRGIRHDGALYIGQALLHLNPEVFSKDLFFAYGSQDRFTVFSRLYAAAIGSLGAGPAAQLFLVVAQLSFAGLTAILLRRLLDGTLFWLGLALVFTWRPFYGGWTIFSYGEPFVTARSFAEPLGLLGLILLLDGRMKASLAVIALTALLHPLVAITTACFWWVYQALRNPRWWLLALAALGLPLLALTEFRLLAPLWERYDDQWWEVVANRTAFVLPRNWLFIDWTNLAIDSVIVLFAALMGAGRRRRFLLAALVTGLLGVALAVAGADLMRNVLLTSLQPWRAHWILHLAAVGMLPFVIGALWKDPANGRAVAALLVTAFVSTRFPGSPAAILMALGIQVATWRGSKLSIPVERVILIACALATLVALVDQLDSRVFGSGELVAADPPAWRLAARALGYPALAVVLIWGLRRATQTPWLRPVAAACALASAALALSAWDQRSAWLKFIETGGAINDRPFAGLIRPEHHVLWHEEMLATWLVLSRPAWYSFDQGTGVLFNRGNALEFERRKSVVEVLDAQTRTCAMLAGVLGATDDCTPDLEALRLSCQGAGDLDFIIIRSGAQGSAIAEWTFADPELPGKARFQLYDCKRLGRG